MNKNFMYIYKYIYVCIIAKNKNLPRSAKMIHNPMRYIHCSNNMHRRRRQVSQMEEARKVLARFPAF